MDKQNTLNSIIYNEIIVFNRKVNKLKYILFDNCRIKTKLYAQQNGVMGSYYEGHIWKQMFPDDPGINPVSTVHLFAQAAIQGQPFVVIDRSNMNEALANITGLGDDTRTDIVNAVFAGNTVTTHSMPINMGDWRGFGYVVFDPRTGSGAYMIDGGSNGGGSGCGGCDKCYASSFSHYYHYAGGSSFVESCKEFFKDAAKWIYDVAIPFLLIKLNWIISAILSILQSLPIIKCILDKSDMTDSQKTWAIIWLILGIIGLIVFGLLGGWLSVFAVILGIIYVKSFKDKYCLVPNDAVRVKRYKLAYKT